MKLSRIFLIIVVLVLIQLLIVPTTLAVYHFLIPPEVPEGSVFRAPGRVELIELISGDRSLAPLCLEGKEVNYCLQVIDQARSQNELGRLMRQHSLGGGSISGSRYSPFISATYRPDISFRFNELFHYQGSGGPMLVLDPQGALVNVYNAKEGEMLFSGQITQNQIRGVIIDGKYIPWDEFIKTYPKDKAMIMKIVDEEAYLRFKASQQIRPTGVPAELERAEIAKQKIPEKVRGPISISPTVEGLEETAKTARGFSTAPEIIAADKFTVEIAEELAKQPALVQTLLEGGSVAIKWGGRVLRIAPYAIAAGQSAVELWQVTDMTTGEKLLDFSPRALIIFAKFFDIPGELIRSSSEAIKKQNQTQERKNTTEDAARRIYLQNVQQERIARECVDREGVVLTGHAYTACEQAIKKGIRQAELNILRQREAKRIYDAGGGAMEEGMRIGFGGGLLDRLFRAR